MSAWKRARRKDIVMIVALMLGVVVLGLSMCEMPGPGFWGDIRH